MISDLIDLGKALVGWSSSIGSAKRDRRHRVADLLMSVSECTADIAEKTRTDGRPPQDRCAELYRYREDLIEVIRDAVGEDEAWRMQMFVARAFDTRLLLTHLIRHRNSPDLAHLEEGGLGIFVDELDRTAGSLRASANLIRAK